jgi:hypothetical protein
MAENGSEVKLHKNFGVACVCVCVCEESTLNIKAGTYHTRENNLKNSKF